MAIIIGEDNPTGLLSWNGIDSNTAAWGIFQDLTVLLAPGAWRGESIVVPHQQGRVPQPVMIDEQTVKFRLPIAGDVNHAGLRFSNPVAGYISNQNELVAACTNPSPLVAADGCIEVTYTVPGYGPLVARCQLFLDVSAELKIGTDMIYGRRGALKRAMLTIRMPNGLFEP